MPASNYIQKGDFIEVTAGADVAVNELVQVGSLFGIATTAAANGERYNLALTGIFEVPKTTGAGTATTAGGPVYFDAGAVTGEVSGTQCGVAVAAAADGASTAKIRLLLS